MGVLKRGDERGVERTVGRGVVVGVMDGVGDALISLHCILRFKNCLAECFLLILRLLQDPMFT